MGVRDVEVVEVGPRDGLQNEAVALPTVAKVELIRRALSAGVRRIEATSFVHPGLVPQLADAEAVLAAVHRPGFLPDGIAPTDVRYAGLVLNRRGLQRALDAGVDEVNVVVVASETFSPDRYTDEYRHRVLEMVNQKAEGQEIIRRVWIYNPTRNAWRAGPSMPAPMDLLGVAAVGNKIHAVLESKYFVYDAATRKWRRGPSLKVPRHALALYAVRGKLYAIGGCIVPQLEDSPAVETLRLTG